MRTQRRFTPALLRRWHDMLRGAGTFDTYTAWHQITRGDPSSRGRSTIEFWPGSAALVDLLSNREQVVFFFCTMLSDAWEIRAQFPLAQNPSQHELAAYSHKYLHLTLPGTVQIAAELGIKHSVVRQGDDEELWVLTTARICQRPRLCRSSGADDWRGSKDGNRETGATWAAASRRAPRQTNASGRRRLPAQRRRAEGGLRARRIGRSGLGDLCALDLRAIEARATRHGTRKKGARRWPAQAARAQPPSDNQAPAKRTVARRD